MSANLNEDVTTTSETSKALEVDTVTDQIANLWGELMLDEDDGEPREISETPEEEQVVAEEPSAVEESVPVTPEPATPVVTEPEPTPEAVAQPEVTTEPEVVDQGKQISWEEYQQHLAASTKAVHEHLEKVFQVSEEDANLMLTTPEKVLPKFAANLYMQMYNSIFYGLQNELPTIIANVQQKTIERDRFENSFYEAWPKLDRTKHDTLVRQIVQMYVQMNPKADYKTVVQNAGIQAMFAAGIDPREVVAEEVVSKPFRPAGAASLPPVPKKADINPFSQLVEDWEDEDF